MKTVQKPRHTLGLAMIMKDEVKDLDRIVKDYGSFFDQLYVTVTDKKTYDVLIKKYPDNPKADRLVNLSYFKWIDHFGKARNYNLSQVKTDYWMWIDLDDEIEGAENIPRVLEYMATNDLDMVWFQYDYSRQVKLSDPQSISRRERVIRTASKLEWSDEAVHETINIRGDVKEDFLSQVIIKHRQTAEHSLVSGERNRLILEKDWHQTHRPITAYYLGTYFGELGDYEGAIEKLLFVVEHSESEMFKFAAWLNLCISYFQTNKYTESLVAADECIAIDPDHPEPWYHKFTAYRAMGDHDSAMQSAEIFMSKRASKGLTAQLNQDISWYQYKGPLNIAHAYLTIGNVEKAYQLYKEIEKIAPQYIDEISMATGIQLSNVFEQAYKEKSDTDEIVSGSMVTNSGIPKIWPKKSIVYFCVATSEDWGPESLVSGIGGSEEAVIHLTKRWAKMGYDVTVYNNCIKECLVDGVNWVRYERFNSHDMFNILITWRLNLFTQGWTADKKIIDIHDTPLLLMHCTYEETENTKLILKSNYHRSLFSDLPDGRITIIPNGVELNTLKNNGETRVKNRLVWTSSYDRGLEHLLEMWPRIRGAVPDATLAVYYGFQVYDATELGRTKEGRAWKRRMKELLRQDGISEHGRVGSKSIAKAYKEADIWAYPTGFNEIDCITATKVMAAGVVPVTTSVGVLPERNQGVLVDSDQVEVFLEGLIALLKDEDKKANIRAKLSVSDYDWDIIAKQWSEKLFESSVSMQ